MWTPDGQRIVYSFQEKGGALNLWWIRADGAGNAQRHTESKNPQEARSWRPDGKVLAFLQLKPDTNWGIMTLPIEGNEKSDWKLGEPKPFVSSDFRELEPTFSPDGRWLAYVSNAGRTPSKQMIVRQRISAELQYKTCVTLDQVDGIAHSWVAKHETISFRLPSVWHVFGQSLA